MIAANSAGIIVLFFLLALLIWSFSLTLKSARLLKNIFCTWKFRKIPSGEIQIRSKTSFKKVLKRVCPWYGALAYSSVQFELPPICHVFQILSYVSLVWGANFYFTFLYEAVSVTFGLVIGSISSVFSVVLCRIMHDCFVRSFNKRQEFEIKVADNSTILDHAARDCDTEENKAFPAVLVLSCMAAFVGGFSGLYCSSLAEEDIFVNGFVLCCLSWALDLPIRFLASFVILKFSLLEIYEAEYVQFLIEIQAKDVTWMRLQENYGEERLDSCPNQDVSLPFDYSSCFSPKAREQNSYSAEVVVRKVSPIESEPEQEQGQGEKHLSDRSHNTLASHNEGSEDENIQENVWFCKKPAPRSPVYSQFCSPVKYQSPAKASPDKSFKGSGLIRLKEVLVDYEPNSPLDPLVDERGDQALDWQIFFEKNPEENCESSAGLEDCSESPRGEMLRITELSEKIGESDRTEEKSQPFGSALKTNQIFPKEEIKEDLEAEFSYLKYSGMFSKRKIDSFGNSCLDSFEKSDNFAVTEDYRADNEGEEDLLKTNKSKNNPETKQPEKKDPSSVLTTFQKMLKIKKNRTLAPKNSKIAELESKPGKTLISLHRKLISFEEDLEENSPIFNQFVSPLTISVKDSPDIELPIIQEAQEKPTNLNYEENSLTINHPEPLTIPVLQPQPENQKTESSLESVSSSSEQFPSKPKPAQKPSPKKPIQNHYSSNCESEEIFDFNNYRSKSGDERTAAKPPQRPSRSREEQERLVFTSAERKRMSRVDKSFVSQVTESRDLVKDRKVFDKKNKKEILKNIEKILEVKENEFDDIEVVRLKAMLASRQSFKKKHLDIPKDTPYSQKIPNICSDGSTPVEEYRLDPEAMRKREERLKRISSIYSSKRGKSGKRQKKTLSPSKSENFMRNDACL